MNGVPRARQRREGLRIVGGRGPRDVRRCLVRYARWLRERVEFPVRLTVYLSPRKVLTTSAGALEHAILFVDPDRSEPPYILIAAGDWNELRRERGRDNALSAYLHVLSEEIVHYRQWIERKPPSRRGAERKGDALVAAYAKCVDRPLETRESDNAFIGEWNDMLQEHINRGRWPEAKRMLRTALAHQPKSHLWLNYLAFCEYEQGRLAPALRLVRRAQALKPRCPSVLIIHARIAHANGRTKLARELCERILARTPRSLASGACGEGLAAARRLRSDARALAKRCR